MANNWSLTENFVCETKCGKDPNDEMVSCDKCRKWFHYECVEVDATIQEKSWHCNDCAAFRTSKMLRTPPLMTSRITKKALPMTVLLPADDSIQKEKQGNNDGESSRLEKMMANFMQQNHQENIAREKRMTQQMEQMQMAFNKKVDDLTELSSRMHSTQKQQQPIQPTQRYLGTIKKNSSQIDFNKEVSPVEIHEPLRKNFWDEIEHSDDQRQTQADERNMNTSNTTMSTVAEAAMITLLARESLPQLPEFGGNIREWPYFEQLYKSNKLEGHWTPAQAANKLRERLTGEAREVISSLVGITAKEDLIMRKLKFHYGDPDRIVLTLIGDIERAREPKQGGNKALIILGRLLSNLVSTINALECESHQHNPSLVRKIVMKLNESMQADWSRQIRKGKIVNPTLEELNNWMEDFVMSAIQIQPLPEENVAKYESPQMKAMRPKPKYSVNVCNEISKGHTSNKCLVCLNGTHKLENCEVFKSMNVDNRWKKVKLLGIRVCCLKHREVHMEKGCDERKSPCGIEGCWHYHHELLHSPRRFYKNENKESATHNNKSTSVRKTESSYRPNQGGSKHETISHARLEDHNTSKLFKIVEATLEWRGKKIKTNVFMDDGSSPTVIEESLMNELQLEGEVSPFYVQYANGNADCDENSKVTSFFISAAGSNKRIRMEHVHTVMKLDLPTQAVDVKELKLKYRYLSDVPLRNLKNTKPRLLIGLEHAHLLMSLEVRARDEHEPVAARTKLGWVVFGKQNNGTYNDNTIQRLHHICECSSDLRDLHQAVKSFFSTDSFGVKPQTKLLMSNDDKQAEKIIKETMRRVNSRYEIGLLWKHDNIFLPDSSNMAMNRFKTLEIKMKKDPEYAKWLVGKVEDYVKKGYARKATAKDLENNWPRISYIPIFTVVNKNKIPLKPRMVFDFAAKTGNISVNSMLLRGPDLLVSLVKVLRNKREGKIAVGSDVEEMFNRIKIIENDQQCQRFYFNCSNKLGDPDTYIFEAMAFGPTCSPACSQAVKNDCARRHEHLFPEASTAIINYTYVDDYLNSHDSLQDAINTSKQVIKIFKEGGFNLRNFISNSSELLAALPRENVKDVNEVMNLNLDAEDCTEKVLGLHWNTRDDNFVFKMNKQQIDIKLFDKGRRPTKREVLRTVMQVFDPLGLISFFIIRGKILLQEIWRTKTDWDEPIPEPLHQWWIDWFCALPTIQSLKFPRMLSTLSGPKSVEMHTFVDASEAAFAAVVYFRFVSGEEVEVSLESSKAKVTSITLLSIPKKELQGAVLGARLADSVGRDHNYKITSRYFWTDSTVVLAWIRSTERRYQQFVGCRVGEILTLTDEKEWRYVPTKLNVADDATKWINYNMPQPDNRWFTGPDFLKLKSDEWPKERVVPIEETILMINDHNIQLTSVAAIHPEKFSSYRRLVRTIATVSKYLVKLRGIKTTSYLTAAELNYAESLVLRSAQWDCFRDEVISLTNNQPLPKESKLAQLSPYIDERGVIRMRGRIEAAEICITTKRPALLSNKHHVSYLIIKHLHERNCHCGQEAVVFKSRIKFWIVNVRSLVKQVQRCCNYCKIRRAVPVPPLMGQLPKCRVVPAEKLFSSVGMDLFGPIIVTVGRANQKRWGMIFVCMTSRAIHLELVEDLTSNSCILAIRNFVCRRGHVKEFWSDNGTNFRGADSELTKSFLAMKHEIGSHLGEKGTEWRFIPPGAPHFGGIWERLIGIVKNCLKFMINESAPRVETLRSALIEVEYIVNSRPLTHVPLNHEDEAPLTPNFLLTHSNVEVRIPASMTECEDNIRIQWKISQKMVNTFWKRWTKECLPLLTRRSKWFQNVKNLEEGDLVLIVEENAPRSRWVRGRITTVYTGKDKVVRVAEVTTSQGLKYRRPAAKLALLDVCNDNIKD